MLSLICHGTLRVFRSPSLCAASGISMWPLTHAARCLFAESDPSIYTYRCSPKKYSLLSSSYHTGEKLIAIISVWIKKKVYVRTCFMHRIGSMACPNACEKSK